MEVESHDVGFGASWCSLTPISKCCYPIFWLQDRGGLSLASSQMPTQPLTPSLQQGGGESRVEKLVAQDEAGRLLTIYHHGEN